MSAGQGSIEVNRKQDPAGAPFAAGAADNGVSIDATTGRVVLGNDLGLGPAGPAILTSDREIDFANGVQLRFLDSNTGREVSFIPSVGFGIFISGDPSNGFQFIRITDFVNGGAMTIDIAAGIGGLFGASGYQIGTSSSGPNGAMLQVIGSLSFRTLYQAITANTNGSANDDGKTISNEGAAGAVTYTLESAVLTVSGAKRRTFYVQNANRLTIQANVAGADTVRLGASVSTAGGTIWSNTPGSAVTLICINGTEWVAESFHGAWTLT